MLLAIGGLLLIIVLNALNVKGAILISIIATTLIGIPLGVTTLNGVAAVPDFGELGNVMFNLDFKGVFTASGSSLCLYVSSEISSPRSARCSPLPTAQHAR